MGKASPLTTTTIGHRAVDRHRWQAVSRAETLIRRDRSSGRLQRAAPPLNSPSARCRRKCGAHNSDETTARSLLVGPTYKWGTVDASVRYEPSWINPGSGACSFEFEVNAGNDTRTKSTFTLQTGVVPQTLGEQAPLVEQVLTTRELDERTFAADFGVKHWMSRQFGWRFGLSLGREQDRRRTPCSTRGEASGSATHRDSDDGDGW